MNGGGKVVCVTGASDYIASWIVKLLLLRGYTIMATIQDPSCDAVFHTASPILFTFTDPQIELIDPAVKGTMDVLNTYKRTSSVRRVILTSSMTVVCLRQPPLGPKDVVEGLLLRSKFMHGDRGPYVLLWTIILLEFGFFLTLLFFFIIL